MFTGVEVFIWRPQLKLLLVELPVVLFPATLGTCRNFSMLAIQIRSENRSPMLDRLYPHFLRFNFMLQTDSIR